MHSSASVVLATAEAVEPFNVQAEKTPSFNIEVMTRIP
jgi:hypothetical protein